MVRVWMIKPGPGARRLSSSRRGGHPSRSRFGIFSKIRSKFVDVEYEKFSSPRTRRLPPTFPDRSATTRRHIASVPRVLAESSPIIPGVFSEDSVTEG